MGKKKGIKQIKNTLPTISVSDRKVLDNKKQCENHRHRLFGYWMNRHLHTSHWNRHGSGGRRLYSTPPTNPIEIDIARTIIWESMGNDWRNNQTSPLEYATHIDNLVRKRLIQSSAESAEAKASEEKKQSDIVERVSGIVKPGSHHTGRPCKEVVCEMLCGIWGSEWTKIPRIECWCKEFVPQF